MNNSINHANDRAAINRENARRSTGPRTPEGKKRASLNAMRHGLTGQTIVSPGQDLSAYLRFTGRFHDDLLPKGAIETQLVQTIADNSWRLNRARVYENNLLTIGFNEQSGGIGVEDPEIDRALATAKAYRDQAQSLDGMSRQEERVSRQFDRALKQLGEIQATRRELEQRQIEQAASLYKLHNEIQQATPAIANEPRSPYDAIQDGFVFANEEIETSIRRQDRRKAAQSAEIRRSAPAGAYPFGGERAIDTPQTGGLPRFPAFFAGNPLAVQCAFNSCATGLPNAIPCHLCCFPQNDYAPWGYPDDNHCVTE